MIKLPDPRGDLTPSVPLSYRERGKLEFLAPFLPGIFLKGRLSQSAFRLKLWLHNLSKKASMRGWSLVD